MLIRGWTRSKINVLGPWKYISGNIFLEILLLIQWHGGTASSFFQYFRFRIEALGCSFVAKQGPKSMFRYKRSSKTWIQPCDLSRIRRPHRGSWGVLEHLGLPSPFPSPRRDPNPGNLYAPPPRGGTGGGWKCTAPPGSGLRSSGHNILFLKIQKWPKEIKF